MKLMPRTRLGFLWRAVLALVLVVGCAAGATATAGLLQVKQIVQDLNLHKALTSKQITPPAPGQPENLLLVGVDHRYGAGSSPGNTDTMMLVRIDDSSTTINALSIPRDLAVDIPGVGVEKLNAAYSIGGPSLLLETLRDDVFPGLQVNHILVVDFSSFSNLINAVGCVYAEIDHRYYNHSVGYLDPTTDYSSIDIQPGYQKLCGGSGSDFGGPNSALAFVRFRHNDSDIVREARQQDFLRWAKESLPSGQTLLGMEGTLAYDFGEDVQTDSKLHTTDGVDELFGLAFNADGHSLKSIPFPYSGGETINGGDDLVYSEAAAAQAYQEFMTPTAAPASSGTTVTTPTPGKKKHAKRRPYKPPATLVADLTDGATQASQLGTSVGMPVYFPEYIPYDYVYCFATTGNCTIGYEPAAAYAHSYPRHYAIHGPGGNTYPAYVMTLVASSGGYSDTGTGEYFTVQGTTWQDPPILNDPSAVKLVDGKVLDEYLQGGAMTLVAWHTAHGVYWISNTIENSIPRAQMVAMAATFIRAAS
jgi:LCP family protein required for cell wall assembly